MAADGVTDGAGQVVTQDGRKLTYLEVGDPDGHGSDGLVRDAELLYRSWAFDVKQIERPVHPWQGLDDLLVPDPINNAVAEAMPGSAWHPVEGAGHFVAVGAGDEIFGIAAEELGVT